MSHTQIPFVHLFTQERRNGVKERKKRNLKQIGEIMSPQPRGFCSWITPYRARIQPDSRVMHISQSFKNSNDNRNYVKLPFVCLDIVWRKMKKIKDVDGLPCFCLRIATSIVWVRLYDGVTNVAYVREGEGKGRSFPRGKRKERGGWLVV